MRKWAKWSFIGSGLIVVLVVGAGLLTRSFGVNFGSCSTDDEIPASQRAPYENEALRFVNAALISDLDAAYRDFSAEAKGKLTLEQFRAATLQFRSAMPNLKKMFVEHIFLLKQFGAGANQTAICTATTHGSISSADGKVIVAAKASGEQAHVIVDGEVNNDVWTITLWLLSEQGEKRVESSWVQQAMMAGKSAVELRDLARVQRDQNHNFNAAVLYAGAKNLAFRGPNLQLGIYQEISKELTDLRLPQEIEGTLPSNWRLNGDTYHVLAVGAVEVEGELALAIRQETPSLMDEQEADVANHKLIAAVRVAHPELTEVFEEILVQAIDAQGLRQFGTVEPVSARP